VSEPDSIVQKMLAMLSHIPHLPKCILFGFVLQQRKTDRPASAKSMKTCA